MDKSKQREKDLREIENFRMFDDTFMSAVFDKRITETEFLIHTILGRDDIHVISTKTQYSIHNIYGRGVRLDILASDLNGHTFHFEVQKNSEGASVQRARFTGAMVDIGLLQKGKPYQEIPDRYTIFITERDQYDKGFPVYHAENTIQELDHQPLGDGSHIVYVNGEYRETETPIGQLMHDFSCVKADDILNPLLRERVKYLKETDGGREEMCEIMERRINEEKEELARKAIQKGVLSLEEIADVLELPLSFVQELADSQKVYA